MPFFKTAKEELIDIWTSDRLNLFNRLVDTAILGFMVSISMVVCVLTITTYIVLHACGKVK